MKVIKKGHGYKRNSTEMRKNYRTHLSKWYYKHNDICKNLSYCNKHKYKMKCSLKTTKSNPHANKQHYIQDCNLRSDLNVTDKTSSHTLIAHKKCSNYSVCSKIFPLSKYQNTFKNFQYYIDLGDEMNKNSSLFMQNYWVYSFSTYRQFKKRVSINANKKPVIYIPRQKVPRQSSPQSSTEPVMDNKMNSKRHDQNEPANVKPDPRPTSPNKNNQKATQSKGNQLPAKEDTSKVSSPPKNESPKSQKQKTDTTTKNKDGNKLASRKDNHQPASKVTSNEPSLPEKREKKEKRETNQKDDIKQLSEKNHRLSGQRVTINLIISGVDCSVKQNDKDKRKTKHKYASKQSVGDQQPYCKLTSGKPSPTVKEYLPGQKEKTEPRKLGNENVKKPPPRKENQIHQTDLATRVTRPPSSKKNDQFTKQATPKVTNSLTHDSVSNQKNKTERPLTPENKDKKNPATDKGKEPFVSQVTTNESSPFTEESFPRKYDKAKTPTKQQYEETGKVRSKPLDSKNFSQHPGHINPLGDSSVLTHPAPSEKESSSRKVEKSQTPTKPGHEGRPKSGKEKDQPINQDTSKVYNPSAQDSAASQKMKTEKPLKSENKNKEKPVKSEGNKPLLSRVTQNLPSTKESVPRQEDKVKTQTKLELRNLTQPVPSEKDSSSRQKERSEVLTKRGLRDEGRPTPGKENDHPINQGTSKVTSPSAQPSVASQKKKAEVPIKPQHKVKGEELPTKGKGKEPLVNQVPPKVFSPSTKESSPSNKDKVKTPTKLEDASKVKSQPSDRRNFNQSPSYVIPLGDICPMTHPVLSEKESSSRRKEKSETPIKPEHIDEGRPISGKAIAQPISQVTPVVSSPSTPDSVASKKKKRGKPLKSENKDKEKPVTDKNKEQFMSQVTSKVSNISTCDSVPGQDNKSGTLLKSEGTDKVTSHLSHPPPSEHISSPNQKEENKTHLKQEHADKPTANDKNEELLKEIIYNVPSSSTDKNKARLLPNYSYEDNEKPKVDKGKERRTISNVLSSFFRKKKFHKDSSKK